MEILSNDLDTLIVCSVRYALGRRSYIVSDVCRIAKGAVHRLPSTSVDVIIRDVKEALTSGHAGDEIDRRSWEDLLSFIQEARKR